MVLLECMYKYVHAYSITKTPLDVYVWSFEFVTGNISGEETQFLGGGLNLRDTHSPWNNSECI